MNSSSEEFASLYVLDQLSPEERVHFEARLLREPELAALVREFESGLEHGVRALPRREPPARLLARIEVEIHDGGPNPVPAPSARTLKFPSVPLIRALAGWGLAAVIAVSLSILAVQSLRRPAPSPIMIVGLDANRANAEELALREPSRNADARFIELASLAQDLWEKPRRRPASGGAAPDANRGYAVFDPATHQGFIAIEKLPALDPKQRYHLWVADALTGRVRDAGVLPLAGSSRGLFSFVLPSGEDSKTSGLRFFVTVEEATVDSSSSRPRGAVVLGNGAL